MLVIDPRLAGSNLARDDGFLRPKKCVTTTSFRWEVKPAVSFHGILWNVKNPRSMKEILVGKIYGYFFSSFS
jgi:hypothetical protein